MKNLDFTRKIAVETTLKTCFCVEFSTGSFKKGYLNNEVK